ncbi:MAG: hypothetical protein ACI3YI_00505 [Bacteroidaceae bacterium]
MIKYLKEKEIYDLAKVEKTNRLIGEIQLGLLSGENRLTRDEWITILTGAATLRGVLALKLAIATGFEPIRHYTLPAHLEGATQFYDRELGELAFPLSVIDWLESDLPVISVEKVMLYYPSLYSVEIADDEMTTEKAAEMQKAATEANKQAGARKPTYKDTFLRTVSAPGYRFYTDGLMPFRVKFDRKLYTEDIARKKLKMK